MENIKLSEDLLKMEINLLRDFLDNINTQRIDSIEMKMIEKIREKIIVYQPQLTNEMKLDLKHLYCDIFSNDFYDMEQTVYNPNIVIEGSLQCSDLNTAHINQIINEINDEDNIEYDTGEINLNKVNYYCFKFTVNNEDAYIFRRFTKMKKVRNGIMGCVQNNTFRKIETENFFGIDRDIDVVVFQQEALIINRFALQTIFRLNDYFNQQATEALNFLNQHHVIENFEDFYNDCLNDKLAARRMTKILNTEGRLQGFIENIGEIRKVIEQFDLEIELNNENKIIYNKSKEARSQILFCISDAYYQSFILRRLGEDIS
ncbi:Kiwa anti-phage protein KwaB-like domain-containing protein [Enterococcus hirae]|uniref:Kiwa anti-phage protein KwaB-like domain-containing protein n=2 Tax=Enterococcus hirae TaxID=1354 RepID=UPI001D146B60|nr:Kiwa anti-phage protein KwaB-like domain-containing protein [Enterococcus hirae]